MFLDSLNTYLCNKFSLPKKHLNTMKVLMVNISYNLSVLCDNKIFENQQYLLSCNQEPQQSLTGDNCGLYVALFLGDFNKVGDTQIQNYDS